MEKTYQLFNAYLDNSLIKLSTGEDYIIPDHELDGYLHCLEDFGYKYKSNEE